MREPEYRPNTYKLLYWLLGSIVAVFVIQNLGRNWFQSGQFDLFFSLSTFAIIKGYIWAFLTYSFLHGSFIHILFNCLMVFWLGRTIIDLLGVERFFTVYGISVLLGGIAWFVLNFWQGGNSRMLGASAGVMGLLVTYAMHYPNQPVRLLLFFVLPVRITPKNLVLVLLLFDVAGLLISELSPYGRISPIAHSAHLGGMLGGWLFVKFVLTGKLRFGKPSVDVTPPKWSTSKKTKKAKTGRFRIKFSNRREMQNEVDRILDKINSQGFGSLSEEEKNTLDKAKELLNR